MGEPSAHPGGPSCWGPQSGPTEGLSCRCCSGRPQNTAQTLTAADKPPPTEIAKNSKALSVKVAKVNPQLCNPISPQAPRETEELPESDRAGWAEIEARPVRPEPDTHKELSRTRTSRHGANVFAPGGGW